MSSSDLAPALLVAMDVIVDPNFHRTVVLMLHHDETRGLGLVINRNADFAMSELCTNLDLAWTGDPEAMVSWGGPVQPEQGWVLLGESDVDGIDVETVSDGVRFSRSRDVLETIACNPDTRARVFLGYAGWGPGQLEREIAEGAWLVVPVTDRLVFDAENDDLWGASVRSLGIEPATLVSTQGIN